MENPFPTCGYCGDSSRGCPVCTVDRLFEGSMRNVPGRPSYPDGRSKNPQQYHLNNPTPRNTNPRYTSPRMINPRGQYLLATPSAQFDGRVQPSSGYGRLDRNAWPPQYPQELDVENGSRMPPTFPAVRSQELLGIPNSQDPYSHSDYQPRAFVDRASSLRTTRGSLTDYPATEQAHSQQGGRQTQAAHRYTTVQHNEASSRDGQYSAQHRPTQGQYQREDGKWYEPCQRYS